MSARLVPVPDTIYVAFAVLTAEPLDRDDVVPLPESALLRRRGSSVPDLDRMAHLPHCRLVGRSVPTGPVLPALEAVRDEAFGILGGRDGLVIDLQIPRILTPDDAGSWAAARYFAFDYDPGTTDVRTHGLEAIGMPEIVIRDVGEGSRADYDMVVVGLVHRLFQEWPQHDPVGPATVTFADMAAGYDGALSDPVDPMLEGTQVLIDYDAEEHLLVVDIIDRPSTST